jgi:hypothetical protein
MRNIYLTFIALLYFANLFAQHGDYDNTSKWFLGLNAGATWNSTDVKSKTASGWGLTLGKSYNYDYGKILSFDLRARYLRGYWYGQDYDTTNLDNYTGTSLNYYDSLTGYSVNNFQADVHRLAFELVIHANRIRERTGFDPYIFGGVGFTWHQTYGDLYDSTYYDYASLVQDGTLSSMLSSTLDGIYDTPLDGSSTKTKVNFMPSLGFGLGYQIGKRTTFGIEHKTTFTRGDSFDGFISQAPRAKNDWYHYTSAYIQFRFKTHTSTTTEPINSSSNINNYNTPCPKPVITVSNSTVTVNTSTYNLTANITEVNSENEISLMNMMVSNGIAVPFTYNSNTRQLQASVQLVPGNNSFTIRVQNNCGYDIKNITIIYNNCIPPSISITNPANNSLSVTSPNFVFSSLIYGINNQQGITLFVNNKQINNYTFNSTTGLLQCNLMLNAGANIIQLEVGNSCGNTSENTTVIYNDCITPSFQLAMPSSTGTTTSTSVYTAKINTIGFKNSSEISITQNGTRISNFSFINGIITLPLQLTSGLNTITINGTNLCGSDAISFAINYQNCNAPIITLVNPTQLNTTSNLQAIRVKLKVENCTKNNMHLLLNNITISNFTFNETTKIVEASLVLSPGNNIFLINASNNCGLDAATLNINYNNCKSPTVTINGANNTTQNIASFVLSASIQNMNSAQGITLTLNGAPINFNFLNGQLTSYTNLQAGINAFVLNAVNGCGNQSQTLSVNYNNCIAPAITLVAPSITGTTVGNANYNFQALVSNITNQQNISVKLNNVTVPSSFLNGVLVASLILVEGNNTVVVAVSNACGNDSETFNITFNKCKAPIVHLTSPGVLLTSTNQNNLQFSGSVENITSPQEMTLKLNGQIVPFTFINGQFSGSVSLINGANILLVTATNACGTDMNQHSIIYNNCTAPNIINPIPSVLNTISSSPQITISAQLQNISAAQQISLLLNGVSQNFTFINNQVNANLNLSSGNNMIVLSCVNNCGTDIKNWNTSYTPCSPPQVNITNPSNSGTTVNTASYNFTATANNIQNAQQISLTLNGTAINNFSYNNGIVSANLTLTAGLNTIVVQANTGCGLVSENSTINFNNCIAPNIILGSYSAATSTAPNLIQATLENISTNQGIIFTQNGTAITNYNFSAGQLSANVILTPGINTFFLSVSNTCGNDQENFVINYNNCIAPIITVQNTGNTNVLVPSYTLNASVNNMPSAQGISISLNGNPLTNFTVNNNQLAAAVNLQAGINTFIISAQNACGSDSETLQVNYDNCKTPVVIINANSGLTVNSGTYNLQAQVSNMNSVQGVLLTFNGQNISNFTYNNGVVLAQVNLIPGANSFVLSAQNECGRDSQILEVNYLNCIAPNVNITSGSGITVSNSAFNLQAQISNMTSSQGLSVQQNGQNISNYTFVNGLLNANITLSSGVNTFTINAQNACGTDAATSTISYLQCLAPTVQINATIPNNSSTTSGTLTINASIGNYDPLTTILVTKNGNVVNGYSNNNGQISGTLNIALGTTVIVVSASNACGTDSDTYTIERCKIPTLTLITPANVATTVLSSSYFIQMNAENVGNINMISATQNGAPLGGMTLSNTIYGGMVTLQAGINTFEVQVATGCGTAQLSFTINYTVQNNGTTISPNGQGQNLNGGNSDSNGSGNPNNNGGNSDTNSDGDGLLKTNNGTDKTNIPVKPVTPAPAKPTVVTPAPAKPTVVTPEPVKPISPKPVTPAPVKPTVVTPDPVKPTSPKPVTPAPAKPKVVTPDPVKPTSPKPVTTTPEKPAVKTEKSGGGK